MKRYSQLKCEPSQWGRNHSNHDCHFFSQKRPKVGIKSQTCDGCVRSVEEAMHQLYDYLFQPCLRRVKNYLWPPHLMLRVDFASTETAFTLPRHLIHTWTRVSVKWVTGEPHTINTGSLSSEPRSFSFIPIPIFAWRSNYHIWQICSPLQPPLLHMGSARGITLALYFWACWLVSTSRQNQRELSPSSEEVWCECEQGGHALNKFKALVRTIRGT